jgi:hypothetical protein
MADNEVERCSCTQRFCKHENEVMCSKPLSERARAGLILERQQFNDHRLGICDECYENDKRHRAAMGVTS